MSTFTINTFHALAFVESVIALSTYYYYADAYRKPSYGGQWKYLSYINLHLKLLYFSLCFVLNLFQAFYLRSFATAIRRFKDFIYATICLPCCFAVFISFWAVYFIDRELVHPAYLDEILPQWANHLFHTSILIIVFEVYFNHLSYPPRTIGLIVCASLELLYLAWVLWVRKQSGIWVYSILKQLQLLGEWLNNKFAPQASVKRE